MKQLKLVLILGIISISNLYAQKGVDEEFKAEIENFVYLVEQKRYVELAEKIVYRGDDESRKWKDLVDYSIDEEKDYVHQLVDKVNAKLSEAKSYKMVDVISEQESEGTWYVCTIQLKLAKGKSDFKLAFLNIAGTMALGDVD